VLAGSTYEDVGFDKRVTGGALAAILRSALVLAPSLSTATLRTSWAGLRPGTPDNLPILGRDPILDGLVHATGHYRNGILLAPVTARRLTALILEGVTAPDLAPFAPSRFTATAQPPSSRSR
jgi:glycine oxidase